MTGFNDQTLSFLENLRGNNNRDWFENNRQIYLAHVKQATQQFVSGLADLLEFETGYSIQHKIFRINRDLRFSKDKTPYNTHIHMSLWSADVGANTPCWMIGLEPGKLTFGAGLMSFSPKQLESWRQLIPSPKGEALTQLLTDLTSHNCRLPEPTLKRVPKPFEQDHPQGELLRRKGLAVWRDTSKTQLCFGEMGAQNCLAELLSFRLLMTWLEDNLGTVDQ